MKRTLKDLGRRLLGRRGPADVHVVSYPKSGRTWLRLMVGHLLCGVVGAPIEEAMDPSRLSLRSGGRSLRFTHDGSSLRLARTPDEATFADPGVFGGRGVVLLTRGLGDTVVSCFHQATKRKGVYEGSISGFVRDPRFGAPKIEAFLRAWWVARHTPSSFVHVTYEQMQDDPVAVLARVVALLDLDVDRHALEAAAEFAKFDNMRRLERHDFFDDTRLRPADPDDTDSYKVRRGRVGAYSDELGPADVAYLRQVVAAARCPLLRL